MLPIQLAAKALDELRRADEQALNYVLRAEAVVPASHQALPGLNVLRSEYHTYSIRALDVLDFVLFRATGHRLADAALYPQNQVCADFDPAQQWYDVESAVDYCARQPDPEVAMRRIVDVNLRCGERGWVSEFIQSCPDVWEAPGNTILQQVERSIPANEIVSATQDQLVVRSRSGALVSFWLGAERIVCAFLHGRGGEPTVLNRSASSTLSAPRVLEFVRESVHEVDNLRPEGMRYRAVPLLVYVPCTSDEEQDIARAVEQARADLEARVFLAEDFDTAVACETSDKALSAYIETACPRAKGC